MIEELCQATVDEVNRSMCLGLWRGEMQLREILTQAVRQVFRLEPELHDARDSVQHTHKVGVRHCHVCVHLLRLSGMYRTGNGTDWAQNIFCHGTELICMERICLIRNGMNRTGSSLAFAADWDL